MIGILRGVALLSFLLHYLSCTNAVTFGFRGGSARVKSQTLKPDPNVREDYNNGTMFASEIVAAENTPETKIEDMVVSYSPYLVEVFANQTEG